MRASNKHESVGQRSGKHDQRHSPPKKKFAEIGNGLPEALTMSRSSAKLYWDMLFASGVRMVATCARLGSGWATSPPPPAA